jgi:hypothetical protein
MTLASLGVFARYCDPTMYRIAYESIAFDNRWAAARECRTVLGITERSGDTFRTRDFRTEWDRRPLIGPDPALLDRAVRAAHRADGFVSG